MDSKQVNAIKEANSSSDNIEEAKKELKKQKKEAKSQAKNLKKQKALEKQKLWSDPNQQANESVKGKKSKALRLKQHFEDKTPPGQKKDVSGPMAEEYNPSAVEAAWYAWWEASGFFRPECCKNPSAENFVIVIPPPNVTGSLHLGHALTNSIQDALVRYHRMSGRRVLWVPGTDHAGIATQSVVEKRLKNEGKTRHDLGREAFVQRVWAWKQEYGNRILQQLRRLGSSLDWSREVFTLDEKRSRAVTEAFVRLYEEKLIYRANRLINWCCALKTAISDIEVEQIELTGRTKRRVPGYDIEQEFGLLYHFVYKVVDSDEEIEVATTRPETMLGDTAVAVHPDDERYKHLHGKFVAHPFCNRKLPIVCDAELVDPTFGTGAVKVTPAHDFNDFECGKRHRLPLVTVLDEDGRITEEGGIFKGLPRFEARTKVVEELQKRGLLRKIEPHAMVLNVCSRSGDVIEPLMKPQWWVDCRELGRLAWNAVASKQLVIIPSVYVNVWNEWLRNIRDWCISRQLWWGHRIPAYLVRLHNAATAPDPADPDAWVVGRTETEARQRAARKFNTDAFTLEQDPDVLDTWFSSGLFPFSVFGWPDDTDDYRTFYPTQLLETGKDILFFWVMRMVMLGLKLTGRLPFREVLLHPIVRDAYGEKMTKSKGNVIDPIDVIEGITLEGLHASLLKGNLEPRDIEKAKETQRRMFPDGISECGTDALRFALCSYFGGQSTDINLDINRVVAYRNFCNKLWNAHLLSANWLTQNAPDGRFTPKDDFALTAPSIFDRWILSRLQNAVLAAQSGFKSYDLSQATTGIYSFLLYDFCDVYLEVIKPVMKDPSSAQHTRETICHVLYWCLETAYRLLHPFMPFLTEELWQRLTYYQRDRSASIMIAPYPQPNLQLIDSALEEQVKFFMQVTNAARNLRHTYNLKGKDRPPLYINVHNKSDQEFFSHPLHIAAIQSLGRLGPVTVTLNETVPPAGAAVNIPNSQCEIYLVVRDLVDVEGELKKLHSKLRELEAQIGDLTKKMSLPDYEKTPPKIKGQNIQKLERLNEELLLTKSSINAFTTLKS
jgi:valyl-tRNA synthetase